MEFRPLEINVVSAKDLKYVNHFTKMDVYAVVTINGDHRTAQRTPIRKDCGSNAEWNYTMKFTIDEAAAQQNRLHLVFRLKSDRHLGDKVIGEVQVPIKEMLYHNNNGNGKVEQSVSYSVRLPNGKPKGILNFSYNFGEKFEKSVHAAAREAGGAMHVDKHMENNPGPGPAMAYPPPPAGYPGSGQSGGHPHPPPPPSVGYLSPPSTGAYPPPQGMAGYNPYPPPDGCGYPPHQYGYPPAAYPGPAAYGGYPSQGGHGHGYHLPVQKPKPNGHGHKAKKGGKGSAFGLGLAGGLLGGMLVGDMVGDAFEGVADVFDCDIDFC